MASLRAADSSNGELDLGVLRWNPDYLGMTGHRDWTLPERGQLNYIKEKRIEGMVKKHYGFEKASFTSFKAVYLSLTLIL